MPRTNTVCCKYFARIIISIVFFFNFGKRFGNRHGKEKAQSSDKHVTVSKGNV